MRLRKPLPRQPQAEISPSVASPQQGFESFYSANRDGLPRRANQERPRLQTGPGDLGQLGPAENYRAITPIAGFDCELLQINTAERCLQLIQAGAQEGRHPPEPYYVRPADAIAGRSLIDKLLNL